MGKATLILILGSIVLFTVYSENMNDSVWWGTKAMVDRYSEIQAKQSANSMINVLLTELAEDRSFRVDPSETKELFEVTVDYRIIDTILVNNPDSLILIDVVATYNEQSYRVQAFTEYLGGWVPPFIRGAWTANADLNNTISDMYIDGRNYKLDGTIDPGTGKPAVSSATTFTNVDNAAIGGTYNGVDIPMAFPHDPLVIEQNVDWGVEGFPDTPDEILGYDEGTLMAIAQSGENGSQYIKNPGIVKIGKKKFMKIPNNPVSGVTYVEITNGAEYEFIFQGNGNSGIVVINTPGTNDSRIKGVKFNPDNCEGIFTGLLITDYSFHHHISIVGAVLQLSDSLESDKNCNGNKDHFVHYSSEAVIEATKFVAEQAGSEGNKEGDEGAIGGGRKQAIYWYE